MLNKENSSQPVNRKQLSLLPGLFSLIVIILVVTVSGTAINAINEFRSDEITSTYTAKIESYRDNNQSQLEEVFAQIPSEECLMSLESYGMPLPSPSPGMSSPQCQRVEPIKMISNDLTDFSSLAFVVLRAEKVYVVRLSGESNQLYGEYRSDKDVVDAVKALLKGEVQTIPWAQYDSNTRGKEIIVPVKNAEGTILGGLLYQVVGE